MSEMRTITSNEDHVRLKIYEGDLQLSEAAEELLRIEKAQHDAERRRHIRTQERLGAALAELSHAKRRLAESGITPADEGLFLEEARREPYVEIGEIRK